jgi:hypothetical protein
VGIAGPVNQGTTKKIQKVCISELPQVGQVGRGWGGGKQNRRYQERPTGCGEYKKRNQKYCILVVFKLPNPTRIVIFLKDYNFVYKILHMLDEQPWWEKRSISSRFVDMLLQPMLSCS